ncbi:hypothetical protein [Actinokineospora bangkokensis]|uniref:DNA-binding protein n=1 Tax=Actinokineospora bangkokensis TaxID=1193682 RepID=A0A1Q9LC02_9PSEU|nr:hypothetical protein [Actinokineospora bangkokensis]OLR89535.1 hypothetical protein BJP25_05510 [Actinokineospora bangkokensis]
MTNQQPLVYSVHQTASQLGVDPATPYRAIREDAFPALKIRSRYAVPTKAMEMLMDEAVDRGGLVDVAELVRQRRDEKELNRLSPGWRR